MKSDYSLVDGQPGKVNAGKIPYTPHIGYYQFHNEVNMNFQLNRAVAIGVLRPEEIEAVAGKIHNLADWKREFLSLAEAMDRKGDNHKAASYYRMAEFFMTPDDPDKQRAYDRFIENFHEGFKDKFSRKEIIEELVPYENGYLPVMRLPASDDRKKGVLVAHGGYDSFIEELYPLMYFFQDWGYEVIAFEGPGQGGCLRKYGLTMRPEWEKPVGAVLNHYGLSDVTLMGISLGGYLAPRAAAFEKRITRVIAYDVIYDFYGCLASARGHHFESIVRSLTALRAAPILNTLIRARMQHDPFISWGVNQGMHVFGVTTPYRFIQEAMRYTTRGISQLITQDFLLLAGTNDHFIPTEMFFRQARALTNVRSLTCRLFTEEEIAGNHCQIGNAELALRFIASWMDEIGSK